MNITRSINQNSSGGTRLKMTISRIWLVLYILAVFASALMQFVLLPKLFASYHYGEGLILGTDSCKYHSIAIEQSREIGLKGWSVFDLRPEHQVMAGIASIVYFLISPHPWALIPFNSALFATSAVLLLTISENFIKNRYLALVSVLPFCLFPTTAFLYSQITKDAFIITAALCLVFSWMIISRCHDEPIVAYKDISKFLLLNTAGLCSIILIRPYLFEIYKFLFLILSIFVLLWKLRHNKWRINHANFGLYLVCLSLVSMLLLSSFSAKHIKRLTTGNDNNLSEPASWEWNKLIPDFVEGKMIRLTKTRNRFYHIYKNAGSNIDEDIQITSATRFIRYMPRALSIVMFSPFPDFWRKNAASEGGSIRRAVSAVEMSIIYLLLLFLPASVYFWHLKPELWTLMIFCTTILSAYAFAVPNIGALYRLRYSFLILIVVLAFAGMIQLLQGIKSYIERDKTQTQPH